MKRLSRFLMIGMAVVMVLSLGSGVLAQDGPTIVVGNKNFTEQYIAGQLMVQALEAKGFNVELKSDLSSMVMRQALENGEIDVCMEYTGTAWMVHLGQEYTPTGHEALYYMTSAADAANSMVWLQPIWNHNSYALAVWPEFAQEHDVYTVSDLARYCRETGGEVKTFIDFEFSQRPDGWPAMTKMYDFEVDDDYLETAAPGASLIALAKHQVDVAMVFATDASIAKHGWVVLQDDKNFFPPYDLCPVVRADVVEEHPGVAEALNELVLVGFKGAAGIPFCTCKMMRGQKTWQMLNAGVDEEKKDASEVAATLLFKKNLN